MQWFVNSRVDETNGIKRAGLPERCFRPVFWNYMSSRIKNVAEITKAFKFRQHQESVYVKADYASEILDLSNQFGEGWLIAGEIACYARQGINRVVCVQPFGCIANHIVAKGIEKRLKKFYPDLNLLYLDIDGGVAEVNLQNRLHFLIN